MERETVSGPDTADGTQSPADMVPGWWTYAHEFPHWYVWRGVTGRYYYARIPRTSPPVVVRALNAEDLRDEIVRAEMSSWPVSSRSQFRNHCA